MRIKTIGALVAVLFAMNCSAADEQTLKTEKDKVSYSLGLSLGTSLKQQGVDVDTDKLLMGIKDALAGGKALLTDQEVREVLNTFQKGLAEKQAATAKAEAAENKKKGDAFLAENAKKEGVKTTASGLQYKVLKEGTGPKPKATDTVVTHYRGTLIDGTEFDSSYSRNEPAQFPVNGVIKGWTEALQLMPVGSKWQVVLPAELAYGERGAGDAIGPNETLIFEVELLSIEKEKPEEKPAPEKQ